MEDTKKRVSKRIEDLDRRLKEGDFSKPKPRREVQDNELTRLQAEKNRIQEKYDRAFHEAELKQRTLRTKLEDAAIEAWGLTRALMATGELSFILIQGGIQTLTHPKNAVRAMYKAIQHGWSESKAENWNEFIKAQPWYPIAKKSKLALSEYDARLDAREENFLGGWVNHIWDGLVS